MPAEYRYIDGTLRPGYFCDHCGETVNMLGSGHFDHDYRVYNDMWICKSNRKLVDALRRANPTPGTKPHIVWSPDTFKYPHT